MGSPPHMRGKAWTMPISTSITSDHPRICGEKVVELVPDAQRQGSPPHMRGKALNTSFVPELYRITPAYAGKSSELKESASIRRDHPRICGEKYLEYGRRYKSTGSPPHMRGKVGEQSPAACRQGITPAYAGKSFHDLLLLSVGRDHPRICGEKSSCMLPFPSGTGSPPHMRGKVERRINALFSHRITPAYAGKRLKRSRSTVPPVAIVPLFPSVCNKPVVSDGSPAGRDAPLFLPAENAVPASPAYNLRSL